MQNCLEQFGQESMNDALFTNPQIDAQASDSIFLYFFDELKRVMFCNVMSLRKKYEITSLVLDHRGSV